MFAEVSPNPLGQLGFGQFAFCQAQHNGDRFYGVGGEFASIQPEKKAESEKAGAFVAISEGMVADDAEAVSSGQTRQIGCGLVRMQVLGAGQRRIESASVSRAGQATVFRQSFAE